MSKEKVFVIDGPNVHYVVNPNTEEGREDARVFLSDFEGVPYKWFKEATGKEHWVMYDSRAFEVIEKCGLKILHYISDCEIDPVMPVNGSSCNGMFEDVDLNKVENNESEEQLYKDWLESNNLLDQGVRDAYKNSIENKFKELYHDDINSYHSRKLNS